MSDISNLRDCENCNVAKWWVVVIYGITYNTYMPTRAMRFNALVTNPYILFDLE